MKYEEQYELETKLKSLYIDDYNETCYNYGYVKWLENQLDEKNNIEKVYVVTSGSYSDYQINHIFLNEKDADQYVEEMNKGDYKQFCVEVFNLNKTNIKTRERWRTDVYSKEPIFKMMEHCIEDDIEENKRGETTKYTWCWEKDYEPNEYYKNKGELIGKVFSYISEEHCKKLAVELYQEYLRRNL